MSNAEFHDLLFAMSAGAALALVMCFGGCAPALYVDQGPPAADSNDTTALLIGCGETRAVGHLYCRLPAGTKPTGDLFVVVPPVTCEGSYCATVTVFQPDASQVIEKPVAKGQSYVRVPWTDLVGAEPLAKDKRGFWPVLVKWSWTDPQTGVVMAAAAEGEIRLRVFSADYTPLSYDPESQTWSWTVAGRKYGATDKGRTTVAPSGTK